MQHVEMEGSVSPHPQWDSWLMRPGVHLLLSTSPSYSTCACLSAELCMDVYIRHGLCTTWYKQESLLIVIYISIQCYLPHGCFASHKVEACADCSIDAFIAVKPLLCQAKNIVFLLIPCLSKFKESSRELMGRKKKERKENKKELLYIFSHFVGVA